MKTLWALEDPLEASGSRCAVASAAGAGTLIITSSNAANNTLLVYDTQARCCRRSRRAEMEGVGGNAGGMRKQGRGGGGELRLRHRDNLPPRR